MRESRNSAAAQGRAAAQRRKETARSWLSLPPRARSGIHPDADPAARKPVSQPSTRVDMQENRSVFRRALLEHPKEFLGRDPVDKPFGDLDNEIHPLWEPKRWRLPQFAPAQEFMFENKRLWEAMVPSLRLASRFISEPKMLRFFVQVAHGEVHKDPNSGSYYYLSEWHYGEKELARVRHIFQLISENVEYCFRGWGHPTSSGVSFTGGNFIRDYKRTLETGEKDEYTLDVGRADIFFSTTWKEYFLRKHNSLPVHVQMAQSLQFAELLVHELAHAFTPFAHPFNPIILDNSGKETNAEPSTSRDSHIQEAGLDWQYFAMGPLVYTPMGAKDPLPDHHQFLGDDMSTAVVLGNDDWTSEPPEAGTGTTWYIRPSAWVHAWFLKETWDRIAKEGHEFMKTQAMRLTYNIKRYKFFRTLVLSTIELDEVPVQYLFCTPEHRSLYYTVQDVDITEAFKGLDGPPEGLAERVLKDVEEFEWGFGKYDRRLHAGDFGGNNYTDVSWDPDYFDADHSQGDHLHVDETSVQW